MSKKMMLFGLFLMVFAGSLFANGIDYEAEGKKSEEEKQEMAERIKISYFEDLDSLIANNKLIESVVESDVGTMQAFEGDPRQIIIFYKYMRYGDPAIQKRGIERIPNWYGNPKKVEKFKQDSIFVNYKPKVIKLLYDFLDDEYPAFQVASAFSLASMGFSDTLITNKLHIYANRMRINDWNLEYTTPYISMNYAKKYYGLNYTDSELLQFKRQAIEELIRNGKKGLEMIEGRQKGSQKNSDLLNLKNNNKTRDLDWDNDNSKNYCRSYWNTRNNLYIDYSNNGGDCANFASQCLIAGYYEDITYSPYADTCGCIPYCPNLNNYISVQSDVVTNVVDFHSNGWENEVEPNNHIPNNFAIGDIAILGKQIWGADSLYQHAIICCKIDNGTHYFGAHSSNRIDRTMTWFIGPDSLNFDYTTFYHITNDWNCNTQIAGGNVSGTWTHENSPYCVTGEITIPLGSQLIIEPGVDVIFTGQHKFNIYGTLLANGDWQRYINFTAQDTITGWEGLHFINQNSNGQSNSELTFCKLKYGRATGGYPNFFGGAVHCDDSSPVIEDCLFQSNTADGGGGAMCLYNWSSPTIRRTRFVNNSAGDGGAIYIWNPEYCSSFPLFEESIFENNTASNAGGAINCYQRAYPVFINCTFNQNTALARNGGGSLYCYDTCNVNFFNTIMWQDSSPELYIDYDCSVEVHDCDLTEGEDSYLLGQYSWVTFEGNILESNPQFVDGSNGNFNLKWSSPCIDKGSVTRFRDEDRSYQRNRDDDGTLPDIGARYYYQPDYVNQPTDLTVSTENDSLNLDWVHGDGAIFYKIYESIDPYNSFTVIDSVFGNTEYSKPVSNNKNFYKITGANNRTIRGKSSSNRKFNIKSQ